jgi:hypothetical protein
MPNMSRNAPVPDGHAAFRKAGQGLDGRGLIEVECGAT